MILCARCKKDISNDTTGTQMFYGKWRNVEICDDCYKTVCKSKGHALRCKIDYIVSVIIFIFSGRIFR